ncbi:hypothetical protein F3Y22_tig00111432pilonHSYRG00024 [Hibiscus syriacus]|uniref:Uncharacterized protein n=1 Tax=Hibiscus syriacus TaxID=106335 RepID=A0A6A2XP44_HIBSY|nr:hypothetical protein F3Y22_tig00111432pilonHSYRG00024 [Hibiscus syriacus]
MAEKQSSSMARKSFFGLFLMIIMLFVLSWLFLLRSTGRPPRSFNPKSLPTPKLPTVFQSSNGLSRTILVNNEKQRDGGGGREEELPKTEQGFQDKDGALTCNGIVKEPLKIFMYDLDPEFHFGLLNWKPQGESAPDEESEQSIAGQVSEVADRSKGMEDVRWKKPYFGRYPLNVVNVDKDVIAPYRYMV